MWRKCVDGLTISCRRAVRTLRCQPTLIQYWRHSRAWRRIEGVPLGQLHSHSHHLAEYLGFLRMAENANRNWRKWVRLQNNFFAAHAAPGTRMSVASFHKINGPLVFGTPRPFQDAIARFIDLNKTSRRQDRVHGEILSANISIREVTVGELGQVRDRNQSPLFDHPPKIGGAALVETGIHAHRNLHRGESG